MRGNGVAVMLAGSAKHIGLAKHTDRTFRVAARDSERRGARRRAWIRRLVLGFVLGLALGPAPASRAGETPGAVEFKFSFTPKVATPDNRKVLWDLIGADLGKVDQKHCRLIEFLDVAGTRAEKAGFLVRYRAKLDDSDCPLQIPDGAEGDLTLKFRSADMASAAHQSGQPWAQAGDDKFEQDVSVGASALHGVVVGRAYSVSATMQNADPPGSMKALRKLYPNALPAIPADAALGAGCRRALEERWVVESASSTNLPKEVELAVWYRVSKTGKREAAPMLAELSFKASLGDPDSEHRADELAARVMRTVRADWLAQGSSKTSALFKCTGK